jgi:hypothetical protein
LGFRRWEVKTLLLRYMGICPKDHAINSGNAKELFFEDLSMLHVA